jgi:carbohydrate-selective porin OprB
VRPPIEKREQWTLGVWHDTSLFENPYTLKNQRGSSSVYARFTRGVWTQPGTCREGEGCRFLNLFSTASYSPDSAQPSRAFADLGINLHGLQIRRPQDHYGWNIAYLKTNTDELLAEEAFRLQSGTAFRSPSGQLRLAANAHLEPARSFSIEPSVAYMVHPNVLFPTLHGGYGSPRNGFVLGFVSSYTYAWPWGGRAIKQ